MCTTLIGQPFNLPQQPSKGTQLTDAETMLERAKQMTWKGLRPVVELSRKVYAKGVALSKAVMRVGEAHLERNPLLPKWDILILPAGADCVGIFMLRNHLR